MKMLKNAIEYLDDIHTYLINGVIVPSVSSLVNFANPKDFSQIPQYILDQAREYGTAQHEGIYKFLTTGEITEYEDERLNNGLMEFMRLKDEYISNAFGAEVMVGYKGRYAGRFDLLSQGTLIDYKTNYKPDIESLEWQMGFYKLAIRDTLDLAVIKCMCLWLPKGKAGKWIEINPRPKEDCLNVLKEYEEAHKSEVMY